MPATAEGSGGETQVAATAPQSDSPVPAVLTVGQVRQRAMKRKALGLDGGLAPHRGEGAARADANRPATIRKQEPAEDAAMAASAMVPPPPIRWDMLPAANAAAEQATAKTQPQAVSEVARPRGVEAATGGVTSPDAATLVDAMEVPAETADAEPRALLEPAQSGDSSIAMPATARIDREQRVVEAAVAQIQAQQLRIAEVNLPESLPLEVLKAI